MADFLDQKVREIRERLREIEPLIHEYNRLRGAMEALDSATPTVRTSSSGAPRSRASRRGRPRAGQPTRAEKLVALVDAEPGITVAQAAKTMSVAPNGLYPVVAKLSEQGRLRKEGSGLFPLGAESSPDGRGETEPQQREVPEAAGD